MVIGLTIVAYGTSTPELAASIAAAGEHGSIILGNIVGSNIANIGMVVGISAAIVPLAVDRSILKKEVPIMIGVSILLVLVSVDGEIAWYDGAVLLAGLVVFTAYTLRRITQRRVKGEAGTVRERINPKYFGYIGIGIVLLYAGAVLTVDNAVILAKEFGLSEKIIGLTVIAVGTSLPELITSVVAIRKGHTNIGIGNIIGSNIYNILMIVGISATLSGIVVAQQVFADYVVMIAFSMVMLVGLRMGRIGKAVGIGLLAGYLIYQFLTGIGAGIGYECCPL
jgi:cation:H+ antiporter